MLLNKGELLGTMEPATLVSEPELATAGNSDALCVAAISATPDKTEEDQVLDALGVDSTKLPPTELDQLRALVQEYTDLFALSTAELGQTSVVTHSINTGDHPPVRQPPHRIPFALRERVCQLSDDMLNQGIIEPSGSPWASPVVLVAKKDGSTRFCVDYRKLNSITKLDVYPLPRIDDSLDLLANTQYFTSLDLMSGYWQVGMAGDSQEKTAFTTHRGLYELKVMPFGLCNAPATFQRLMEGVLSDLVQKKCLIYLHDILVIGQTFTEHLSNLQEVFERLRDAGLHPNAS